MNTMNKSLAEIATQSFQSQFNQIMPQGDSEASDKRISTPVLKLVKNTFVFENAVYQIRNMSSVEFVDLTQIHSINSKIPSWYWFLAAFGFIMIFFYGLGLLILLYVGYLIVQHGQLDKVKTDEKYGLRLVMNSGEGMTLVSRSKEFVLKVIVTLTNILNSEEATAVTFNFDTLQVVEDKSIKIENAYGASVISGQVLGDVVNTIGA